MVQAILSRPAVREDRNVPGAPTGGVSFRLRLSRIKQLVELHGGSFQVSSRPGVGTTVNFTLPVYDATLHMREPAARPNRIPAYGIADMEDR